VTGKSESVEGILIFDGVVALYISLLLAENSVARKIR
jgi:hypothetical protein